MAEKRSAFALFLNTATTAEATYNLVGDGVTELSVAYNPQSKTEQYIHQDSATSDVTSYQPNFPVSQIAKKGDGIFEYINTLRKKRAVLDECYTDIVMVELFETATEGEYPAEKQEVSIQIDTYGGPAADPLTISFTVNFRGDGVIGKFNPSTKKFTDSATPANMSLKSK